MEFFVVVAITSKSAYPIYLCICRWWFSETFLYLFPVLSFYSNWSIANTILYCCPLRAPFLYCTLNNSLGISEFVIKVVFISEKVVLLQHL